jgi:hypothetical protein
LRIAGTLFEGNKIKSLWLGDGAKVDITGSEFKDVNDWGVYVADYEPDAVVSVHQSSFLSAHSIHNERYKSSTVDATNNYWGTSAIGAGVNSGSPSATPFPRTGIMTPPTTTFTTMPDPIAPLPPGTEYTFDASASADAEDYQSSLDFCWDWEDDGGGCDATTVVATHSYASGGLHTARLTVTDTDGLTGTLTQEIQAGYPPTATFVFTQTTWSEVAFDAFASDDVEDDPAALQVQWDWEGDGTWDTGVYSVTDIVTHTYDQIGRYWPAVRVEDTDRIVSTLSKVVDIVPPTATKVISGSGGTLTSYDGTVRIDIYTDTVGSGVISAGLTITHTPWLAVPYGDLPGNFVYQGFNLAAESEGATVDEVTGTYTITVAYDPAYITGTLDMPPFWEQLELYRWTGSAWEIVPFTLDTGSNQLVATVDSFGDFALIMDVKRIFLPLVMKSS